MEGDRASSSSAASRHSGKPGFRYITLGVTLNSFRRHGDTYTHGNTYGDDQMYGIHT